MTITPSSCFIDGPDGKRRITLGSGHFEINGRNVPLVIPDAPVWDGWAPTQFMVFGQRSGEPWEDAADRLMRGLGWTDEDLAAFVEPQKIAARVEASATGYDQVRGWPPGTTRRMARELVDEDD